MIKGGKVESQRLSFDEALKKEDDASCIEATAETASIPLPTFEPAVPATSDAEAVPSYTRLAPDLHELFEKMGGVMLLQMERGTITTSMTIQMPHSIFNGAEVILKQYDTAPHAYNLQLIGSPEAVQAFKANLKELDSSFKEARFNFEVNILAPSISRESKESHLVRRKSQSGGDQDSGGKEKEKRK